jgi:hypothetical protein
MLAMNLWVNAFLRIYELTGILVITILPALATVYAIIISFMGKMLEWSKDRLKELETFKEDANKKFVAKMDSLKGESSTSTVIKELNKEWKSLNRDLKTREKPLRKRENRLSPQRILFTGCLIISSVITIFMAITIAETSLKDWWMSLFPYGIGIMLLVWTLILLILTLKEASWLALEFPVKEKEEYEGLIKKLDEMLGLKKPEFKVNFLVKDKLVNTLTITKDIEEEICIQILNESDYPALDTSLALALPSTFTLRESQSVSPGHRPATSITYPKGAKFQALIGIFPSHNSYPTSCFIKGEKTGEFDLIVWINTTTHKKYTGSLKVIVK